MWGKFSQPFHTCKCKFALITAFIGRTTVLRKPSLLSPPSTREARNDVGQVFPTVSHLQMQVRLDKGFYRTDNRFTETALSLASLDEGGVIFTRK